MILVAIVILIVFLVAAVIVLSSLLIEKWQKLNALSTRFSNVISVEDELDRVSREKKEKIEALNKEYSKLNVLYESGLDELKNLNNQVDDLNKSLNELKEQDFLNELGFYEPHYNFDSLVKYERALDQNRDDQRSMILRGEVAEAVSDIDDRQANAITKLALRAFNGECDSFVAAVDYRNVVAYEKRVKKIFEQINKITLRFGLEISKQYRNLKIAELRIVHEYNEQKQKELEEQRQIKEAMREEIRAQHEFEKAQRDAEREEKMYRDALDKAIAEAQRATGETQEQLNIKISILESQLKEAHDKKERAISQAQLTKSGYVYIISNIGSFGEHVYKIGMTRRLEPMDRIYELGSASVPFTFDVHAMIFSDNAPELESDLHKSLDRYRVNQMNTRKEFFRVELEKIAEIAQKHKADVSFTMIAEAKEYRQTIAKMSHLQGAS